MPLGWIDFSKNERNKVLNVLDLLYEKGTLDELGIAPIRDGFSDLFFPGTTTIQTRAKYFLIVPYTLKDLEYSNEINPNRMLRTLDAIERECGEVLVRGDDTNGVIGRRSLAQNEWVQRAPSSIYWAGLRRYGIFSGGNLSLTEYIRTLCVQKNQKSNLLKLGNKNDSLEEKDSDDNDAGNLFNVHFWNITTYQEEWKENLTISLTKEEGEFLKHQIIQTSKDTMMEFVLENHIDEFIECRSFQELQSLITIFPKKIQDSYTLAYDFSEFLNVLYTVYNMIVSAGENEKANKSWCEFDLVKLASVDLESIFDLLQVRNHDKLCSFLRQSQKLMKDSDLEGLKSLIILREKNLKDSSRAKTLHPGQNDPQEWFGVDKLDYRFKNAKDIIKDIFESEEIQC